MYFLRKWILRSILWLHILIYFPFRFRWISDIKTTANTETAAASTPRPPPPPPRSPPPPPPPPWLATLLLLSEMARAATRERPMRPRRPQRRPPLRKILHLHESHEVLDMLPFLPLVTFLIAIPHFCHIWSLERLRETTQLSKLLQRLELGRQEALSLGGPFFPSH